MPSALISHREKVLAHAEKELAAKGKSKPAELLALYKKFLKIENHRLRLRHQAGGGGRQICEQRASLVDIILRHLFDTACAAQGVEAGGSGLTIIAVGGYGRGELNPFSDVDILFLHENAAKALTQQRNEIIQAVLYMLWDVGFKVGHATRSIVATCKHANEDMQSKTALLEARFVAGEKPLFETFRAQFQKRCVKGFEAEYIADRVKDQASRHEKFGGTVFLQEPNIKNGCGSLRDYQNLLWVSHFKVGAIKTSALAEKKLLSENERRRLEKAYDFLLRVRNELHYLTKRATDQLALTLQFQIANRFDYPEKNVLRRAEAFMRDYYQHARTIYHLTELMAERLSVPVEPKPSMLGKLLAPKTIKRKEEHFDGFIARDEMLYPESSDIFQKDSSRIMRLFLHLQTRRLRLSPDLSQLIGRRLGLVDRTFQYARSTRESFEAILSRKGQVGRILRTMHEVDFLGRYIPEFGGLTCLVQHEFFHRYTADEHTLVCIEKLDEVIDTEDAKLRSYREIFKNLEDATVLYLALLLHDSGKSANVRHHAEASAVFAQRVAARIQLTGERRRTLIFLVDHHLTLSSTAQRRNIDDQATVEEFAAIVRTQAQLDALMLLTLVDGQAIGDETWSDWKESLVWQLYRNTSSYLMHGEAFFQQRKIEREELKEVLTKKLAKDFGEELQAHFEYMPDSYFQTHEAQEIAAHMRLFRKFLEARHKDPAMALWPACQWVPMPDRGHSELRLVTWDRKELLARIAGAIAVAELNILSADIFTRGDSLVLDVFRVCNTKFQAISDEREIANVEKYLIPALQQEDFDFAPLLSKAKRKKSYHLSLEVDFPTRIFVNNDSHPVYTLVEITTPDRLGLLYDLLRGFATVNVNIVMSRITTEKGAAIDSFYVTDILGNKLRGDTVIKRIIKALSTAANSAPHGLAP